MNRFITLLLLGVVGIAMLLVFFVHMKDTESDPPVPVSQSIPVTPAPAPAQPAPQPPAQPSAPAPAPAQPAPEPQPAPSQPQPPAQPVPSRPQTPARPAQPAQPQPAPAQPQAPSTASVAEGSGTIVEMSLHFKDKGMVLRIEGDGPLPARYFMLSAPNRLVVDLPGTWKGLKKPAIPNNFLVKDVRIGRQGNADRLVLDLLVTPGESKITRLSDKKVEIYFAE